MWPRGTLIKQAFYLFSAFTAHKAFVSALSVCSICLMHQKHKAQVRGLAITFFPNRGGKRLRKMKWIAQGDTASKRQRLARSSSISDSWRPTGPSFLISRSLSSMLLNSERWFDSRATGLSMSTSWKAEADSPLWRTSMVSLTPQWWEMQWPLPGRGWL